MKILVRLFLIAYISTQLVSCQTAGSLLNTPMNLINSIFSTVGRTLHVENEAPKRLQVDPRDLKNEAYPHSVPSIEIKQKPEAAVAQAQ